MFCQLKNSLKYVNIQPCHRLTCKCYENFKGSAIKLSNPAKETSTQIRVNDFMKYQRCYNKHVVQNRDIFLL